MIGAEAIVIELVLNTQNWFLLLSLGFELRSNYFYALNFFCFLFLWKCDCWALGPNCGGFWGGAAEFLEHKKKDGFFLLGLEKLHTVSLLMSSHFPKSGPLLFFFLSPSHPRGWVVSMTAKLSWSAFLLWGQSWILCSWHWRFLEYLLNHRTASSGFFFWGQSKNQNQRTAWCGHLKKLQKRTGGFHERTG